LGYGLCTAYIHVGFSSSQYRRGPVIRLFGQVRSIQQDLGVILIWRVWFMHRYDNSYSNIETLYKMSCVTVIGEYYPVLPSTTTVSNSVRLIWPINYAI
jgi:hypothetical protein